MKDHTLRSHWYNTAATQGAPPGKARKLHDTAECLEPSQRLGSGDVDGVNGWVCFGPRKGYTRGNDLPSENEMELAEALLRGEGWVSQDERSVN